ncbi:MAG: phosphoribosylanthranilate isomerase [Cyanobacteria bacterium P01_D01_bin.105]
MVKVKICGITQVEQGVAIAQLGATALGYICVKSSPRYVEATAIASITAAVSAQYLDVEHFGVFANAPLSEIITTVKTAGLNVVQLHGAETLATCQLLRDALAQSNLSKVQLVKAIRVRTNADLPTALSYESVVDRLLLDAYHPDQLGGTGKTLDWPALKSFAPSKPWFLAGGLTPDNVLSALAQLSPDGIDLSSGVERSPGDKDLAKVRQLLESVLT